MTQYTRRSAFGAMRTLVFVLCAVAPWTVAGPAAALDLDQARAVGQVGERPDGLVGAVANAPSAEVRALVEMINRARMDAYRALAQKEGTALEAVQAVAGERQIQTAARNGWYVMTAAGTWQKR